MDNSKHFTNILIIKPGAIGDLLQLTPVIRALKGKYPHARITILVGSTTTAELFKYNKHVSETMVFDKEGLHNSFGALIRLWKRLHGSHYDLVINFQRSNLKTWLLASAAFPCRVLVYHKARSRSVHAVANYLETIAPLHIPISDIHLELTPGAEDRSFAEQSLRLLGNAKGPLIALNPGASHRVNRWGMERFASLADMLVDKLSARVVLIGGPEDISLADEIASKSATNPLIMTGKANLIQLGAILEFCDILVSGDTGPMHLATAVGTRVVALFGAADPVRTGPVGSEHMVVQARGVPCVPCSNRLCTNNTWLECMEKISVSAVFDAIYDMLKNK